VDIIVPIQQSDQSERGRERNIILEEHQRRDHGKSENSNRLDLPEVLVNNEKQFSQRIIIFQDQITKNKGWEKLEERGGKSAEIESIWE
jgi:hypothetical protein